VLSLHSHFCVACHCSEYCSAKCIYIESRDATNITMSMALLVYEVIFCCKHYLMKLNILTNENIKKPGSFESGKGIVRVLCNYYEDKEAC
jgi:hypothetical protein